MGQFSVEICATPGSDLSGNQHPYAQIRSNHVVDGGAQVAIGRLQTIRKILRGQHHDTFRNRQSSLDAWSLTLEAEWTAGCRVGAELWRRLKALGFAGSLRVVSEWTTRRRRDDKFGHAAGAAMSARTIERFPQPLNREGFQRL